MCAVRVYMWVGGRVVRGSKNSVCVCVSVRRVGSLGRQVWAWVGGRVCLSVCLSAVPD